MLFRKSPEAPSKSVASQLADALSDGGWRSKARPSQLPPPWAWLIWLLLTGRGWGKTWTGSSWINEMAMTSVCRIALIGATASDVRDIMIEGDSGVLRTAPDHFRPTFEPSKRRIEWPNGSVAHSFSAEESDRLRGPQFHYGWLDELAAFENDRDIWDMFSFGLRLGQHPRCIVTTTPKPKKLLKELIDRNGVDVAVVTGSTYENSDNLASSFLAAVKTRYEGSRLGRQELHAELLLDIPAALWTREMIERANGGTWKLPDMKRVVIAVDPSGTRGEEDTGDSVGIVVCGLGTDDFGYVLADRTCKLSPEGWGRVVVAAYREFKADKVIAERNYGGAMCEHVIRTVDRNVAYEEVTASRGKIVRAQPVASLYEQNRVRHAGAFPLLEDQLCAMTGDGYVGDGSPDRADALVWGISKLMVEPQHQPTRYIYLNWIGR
jgi:phage terminase large subunit-like protein